MIAKHEETIELTNCGPIARLSIPCPPGGGIVELCGDNDIGKSETIAAVESALTGRGQIDVRRGSVSGEVEAFGVKVKIGKRTTRTGEAVVESLEGRFSIEDLIEPKIKDPLAADAKRIKTLIQTNGKKADATLFHELFGNSEEFDATVSASAVDTDDVVVMAERIKRDCEAAARKLEDQAKHAEGHASGALGQTVGVDLNGEADAELLQKALEEAIKEKSRLDERELAANRAARALKAAQEAIEDAAANYSGPGVATAMEAEAAAKSAEELVRAEVTQLRKQLAEIQSLVSASESRWEMARREYAHAIELRKAAESHEESVAKLRSQLAATIPESPSLSAVEEAERRVTAARQAVEQGAMIRRAIAAKVEADRHAATATELRQKANRLREAGRGTDDVLSSLVAGCGTSLRVEAGRLMVDTPMGPKTFAELSHGTRSRMALDIAIEAVGPRGVICLKQEFWEGVAPHYRKELAAHVAGRGVLVLTARATDDREIVANVVGV